MISRQKWEKAAQIAVRERINNFLPVWNNFTTGIRKVML